MEKVPLTQAGFTRMEAELKQLKGTDRPAVIQAIAEARAHGDLSENAEYSAAREKQSFIEGRILELEDKVSRADVIDVAALGIDSVRFGLNVTFVDENTEEELTYQIVGDYESDLKIGKLSVGAPLARAFIGKKVGDVVEVRTPGGTKSYEITKITNKA